MLGYREKCVTKALYQMRGKTQPIAFVRKPHLGRTKTGNIAKIQGEPKLQCLVEQDMGKTQCPIIAPIIGYSRNKLVYLEWQYRSFCMAIVSRVN